MICWYQWLFCKGLSCWYILEEIGFEETKKNLTSLITLQSFYQRIQTPTADGNKKSSSFSLLSGASRNSLAFL